MIGKINDDLFRRVILPATGAPDGRVVVGPKMGVDAAILKVGNQFMAVAEDPIFPVAGLPLTEFGYFTVHIGASDVAITGIKPEFLTYSLLVPPDTPEADLEATVTSIHATAQELGIAIVGGHTGYYPAVTIPIIGGITVWGYGTSYITPAGAQVGDAVLLTKGAAVEASGLLALVYQERLHRQGIAPEVLQAAQKNVYAMTVVKDALLAAATGGVHAMHDATEGGVLRGLWEIAQASGVGMFIRASDIFLAPGAGEVLSAFGLDPLSSISEGTLLLTCEAAAAPALLDTFALAGIAAAAIGEVTRPEKGCILSTPEGEKPFTAPPEDKFWEVFFAAGEKS